MANHRDSFRIIKLGSKIYQTDLNQVCVYLFHYICAIIPIIYFMKVTKIASYLFFFFSPFCMSAQTSPSSANAASGESGSTVISNPLKPEPLKQKGKFFVYWGYNRSIYTSSNIHIWGDGYDFTLHNVTAKDKPVSYSLFYLSPNNVTIPQYNLRFGYYINDKTFISFGQDHMKYVIDKQTTLINGVISKDNTGGKNIGIYNNKEILIGEGGGNTESNGYNGPSIIDSLPKGYASEFEHCDGLNDFSAEIGRVDQLWISKKRNFVLTAEGTVGAGMILADTRADILGYPSGHDLNGKKTFHLAGFSASASLGLKFYFGKHFFALTRLKAGYINLPDINTTTLGGKASQQLWFCEPMFVLGYTIGKNQK